MPIRQRLANWPLVPLAAALALLAVWVLSPASARHAIANSAILALGTTAIALPLGTLLAVLIARCDLPGRRFAAACLGVLLFLPLYVQLSGWDAGLGKLGWLTLAYGKMDEPFLAGMRGAIFVHAMAAVPWVALLVGLGLSQVDPVQEEAALLVAPPAVVLWRITLPHALPFIVAAAIFTVVGTTSEMTVTNIFLMNPGEWTYTEQFYMTFSLQADASEATLAILPGAFGLAIIVAVTLWMIAQFLRRPKLMPAAQPVTFSTGRTRLPLTILLGLVVLVLLAVPVASLITKAGFVVIHEGGERAQSWSAIKCVAEIASAPVRFRTEFGWTVLIAAAAASLALVIGACVAWIGRAGGWRAMPAILAAVLGLAVPGPLVGVALIAVFNHSLWPGRFDPLVFIYDRTPLTPILAQAIRALPLATLIAWHSFRSLSDDVLAAAALDGLAPRQILWRIALPQRKAALFGAWLAALAIAAGDLAWAHLVAPPGMDLIQRRVFGLVHSGVEEQVAAISLVNVLVYAVLAGLILRLVRRPR